MTKRRQNTGNLRSARARKRAVAHRLNRDFQRYKAYLSKPRLNPSELVELKAERLSLINYALKQVCPFLNLRRAIVGLEFPRQYSELQHRCPLPFSSSLEQELKWEAVILAQYAEKLTAYCIRKNAFENALVTQQLNEARALYSDICKTFGVSLWAVNAGLLLAETEGGLESNRRFLTELQNTAKDDPLLLALAQFFSYRVEAETSPDAYDDTIAAVLRPSSPRPNSEALDGYFHLVLNFHPPRQYTTEELAFALHCHSKYPIIDRFAMFVRVLQLLAADPGHRNTRHMATIALSAIPNSLEEPTLQLLRQFFDPTAPPGMLPGAIELLRATHFYTSGHYEHSAEIAREALPKHANTLDFYDILAKSSVHLQQPPLNPFPDSTLGHQIYDHVSHVVARDEQARDSLAAVLKLAYSFDGMRLGMQLFALFLEHAHPEYPVQHGVLAGVNALSGTARFSTVFSDASDAIDYLNNLDRCSPGNRGVELFLHVTKAMLLRPSAEPSSIPHERLCKYHAIIYEKCGAIDSAIAKYNELYETTAALSPFKWDALNGLLRCYLRKNALQDCMRLAVDAYLANKNAIPRSFFLRLANFHDRQHALTMSADLSHALLFCICFEEGLLPRDPRKLYIAYDSFLSSLSLSRPSQLSAYTASLSTCRLVFFLRYVCVPDVMDSSLVYETTQDLERERISVCRLLLELDQGNSPVYMEEIYRLTRAAMVRAAVRHVEEKKIFIDMNGIRQSLEKGFYAKYERYRALTRLTDDLRKSLRPEDLAPEMHSRVVVFRDVAFTLFAELFNDIKHRFISSSEYGLDSYLSVRIRHGTLTGQLRSQFENLNIVTRKDTETGVYQPNWFWREKLSWLDSALVEAVDHRLRQFSELVDETVNVVKNRWIQIKGPGNTEQGLFDYDYDEYRLIVFYVEADSDESPEAFVEHIFRELRERTEMNLARVRNAIKTRLKDDLVALIDDLERDVFSIGRSIHDTDFHDAVTKCRTRIQNEVDLIAGWFHLADDISFDDFSFHYLIDTAVELVKRLSPSSEFWLRREVKDEFMWDGRNFLSLIDLLFILFENVVKHCGTTTPSALIQVDFRGGALFIRVKNQVAYLVNVSEVQTRIAGLEAKVAEAIKKGAIRSEGGSGYFKLHKIIRYDLRRTDYSVDFELLDDGTFLATVRMEVVGMTR